ncbi:hypothetical protein [Endozoicomonas sp. 2B-B]
MSHSTPKSLSVSLPDSAIATTGSDLLKDAKIVASKKIRFYPENEQAYHDALMLYRRSYNLAVERFRNDDYKDASGKFINMRPAIKAQVEQEQMQMKPCFPDTIINNSPIPVN